jgi:uncharacterized lipoprotein YmbA
MRSRLLMTAVTALVTLGGCGTSPQANFYTLGPVTAATAAYTVRAISVVILPVTLPDMLDRPQIVTRVDANQVHFDEYERWADPVGGQIQRTIAADLGQALSGARVSAYPQDGDPASTYRVRVDIQKFDALPGDAVMVDTLWSVVPPKGGAIVNGRTSIRQPCAGAGYGAVTAAYSAALAVVSRDVATAIHAAQ